MFTMHKTNGIISMDIAGSIRIFDLKQKKDIVHYQSINGKGTCLAYPNEHYRNCNRVFTTGYDNGIIRTFTIKDDNSLALV